MNFDAFSRSFSSILALLLLQPNLGRAESAQVRVGHSTSDVGFKLPPVPLPAVNDVAATAKFSVIAGKLDPNSGGLEVLQNGQIPHNEDDPRRNVFFAVGSPGGRLLVDLGKEIEVVSVSSYSWHGGGRAAQNYELFGNITADKDKTAEGDLAAQGWTKLASVNTAEKPPGQHAVDISPKAPKDPGAKLGKFRYLIFAIACNQDERGFGNTFFSEIDVVAADGPKLQFVEPPAKAQITVKSDKEDLAITLDYTASPDLLPWFQETALKKMITWYPKVAELISLPGLTPPAPKAFTILLQEGQIIPGRDGIPAFASGDKMVVSSKFMRDQKNREAMGCLIHEMVHIVQFGSGKRAHRGVPTWLFEGATDYIRWFLFEPESKGAVLHNPEKVHYNDSYRVTGNFIDWATRTYTKDLIAKIHVAIHDGYGPELWKTWTGKSVEELETEWKANLGK